MPFMRGFVRNLNRLAVAAGLLGGLRCATQLANGQIPCRFEVIATIKAPICPIVNSSPPTIATAISPNGEFVCGRYLQCFNSAYKAFLYRVSTGEFITLYPPGVTYASANDVNDGGMVAGEYDKTGVGHRGFVFDPATGQYTDIDPIPPIGNWSTARGITNLGVVCGERAIGSPSDHANPQTAYRWSASEGYTDLGLINGRSTYGAAISPDGSVVAGTMFDTS